MPLPAYKSVLEETDLEETDLEETDLEETGLEETKARLRSVLLLCCTPQESKGVNDQSSRGDNQPNEDESSVKPLEQSSKKPSQASEELETVDVLYKIVGSDQHEYSQKGNVYFRYIVPPERQSTSWFCIVAFHWQDVRAEFECVYHPSITLFDDFKPIDGTLKGGTGGIQRVELSMWNFKDRGPDLNAKYTVNDDRGIRIMLAIMITSTGSVVKLYGKKIREGDNESEVWLSKDERGRLGLRS